MTRRSGSSNGSPLRNRSLIKLKMAVFMPMPSARVSTARSVNAGDLISWRKAKRRSIINQRSEVGGQWSENFSFGAESDDGVDAGGATGGKPGGDRDTQAKNDDCAEPDKWIARGNVGPLMAHNLRHGPGGDSTREKSEHEQARALRRYELNERARSRTEREADSKFAGPSRDLQREQSIYANGGQSEAQQSEERNENENEPFCDPGFGGGGFQRNHIEGSEVFVGTSERISERALERLRIAGALDYKSHAFVFVRCQPERQGHGNRAHDLAVKGIRNRFCVRDDAHDGVPRPRIIEPAMLDSFA